MYLFKFAFWSCFAGALTVRAIKNITVDDFDPRIEYGNPSVWSHENSAATLDRFNLTTSYTGQMASASLKFTGSAVYFMSYGLPLPYEDVYQVTLDGQSETRSLRVNDTSQRAQYIAFSRTGLDQSVEHQITISNPNTIPLNIDAFIITVPDNSTMKNGFDHLPQSSSSGNSGLTSAAKAGIALGVIGGLLLVILTFIGVHHWRLQREPRTQDPKSEIESGAAPPAPSYVPAADVFPFIGTPSGPQPRQEGYRKDRRPTGPTFRVPERSSEAREDATTVSYLPSPLPLPSSPSDHIHDPPPYAR